MPFSSLCDSKYLGFGLFRQNKQFDDIGLDLAMGIFQKCQNINGRAADFL